MIAVRRGTSLLLAITAASLIVAPLGAYAAATFSVSAALAKTSDPRNKQPKKFIPFPDITEVCGSVDLTKNSDAITCNAKMIDAAGKYCAFIAGGITNGNEAWTISKIPILLLAVTGTALGVSAIPAAKSWAAVGGTSGIASSWNSETTAVASDANQRVSGINAAASDLKGLDITDTKTTISAAVSVAGRCGSAAGGGTPSDSKPSS